MEVFIMLLSLGFNTIYVHKVNKYGTIDISNKYIPYNNIKKYN